MTAAKNISLTEIEAYRGQMRAFYGDVSEDLREKLTDIMVRLYFYPETVTAADMKALEQQRKSTYSGEDEWLAQHKDKPLW